jgi:DNA-binding cell septation regulator SpoVG
MLETEKPAGASGGPQDFRVSNWRAHEKNTLRAFLTLTLPSGLILHNCSFHAKDQEQWIGLPTRQYKTGEGTVAYAPLIEFASKEARQRFQSVALLAVKRFLEAQG